MRSRVLVGVLVGAAVVVGAGCATTINLSAPTTIVNPVATTLPTGTNVQLFDQLHSSIAELSVSITDEDKTRAKSTLATVLNVWGCFRTTNFCCRWRNCGSNCHRHATNYRSREELC